MSAPPDTREQAQPQFLTAEQAIGRLRTWDQEPSEETVDALVQAALRMVEGGGAVEVLFDAAKAYRAEQVERVQTSTGSMGCACDADDIRRELRASSAIVEVAGETMGGIMLRARGCYIAYKDADGRWRGVGSTERDEEPWS